MSYTVVKGYDGVVESRRTAPTLEDAVEIAQVNTDLADDEAAQLRRDRYWSESDQFGGVEWVCIASKEEAEKWLAANPPGTPVPEWVDISVNGQY